MLLFSTMLDLPVNTPRYGACKTFNNIGLFFVRTCLEFSRACRSLQQNKAA
jgi:hypothetical protein